MACTRFALFAAPSHRPFRSGMPDWASKGVALVNVINRKKMLDLSMFWKVHNHRAIEKSFSDFPNASVDTILWQKGPGNISLDLNVTKKVKITETKEFELRVDAVNVLNHPNFAAPPAANLSINSTSFGRITSATGAQSFVVNSRLNF